jgi:putative peptidoglycan lipid II flippase
VVVAAGLGATALVAAAWPIARFFGIIGGHGTVPDDEMARALVAFAPGLFGFCVVYHLNRALLASGRVRRVGVASAAGWLTVVLVAIVLTRLAPQGWVVAAVGLAHTVGMTVAAVLLLVAARPGSARAGWRPLARSGLAAVAGAACGGGVGWFVADALDGGGTRATIAAGALSAAAGALVFGVVVAVVDRRDLRALMRR